ncbi:hypothetical protein [Nocardioides sp.]|uniref:glucosamine inositolphosphorylceramide transferase family protein n=1 Tax=Nocardioides sp. TaxID=35761 RepID=UPI0025E103A5|nr:hypothetical protein [Nocardioides sp.]
MDVELLVLRHHVRRWHLALVEELTSAGVGVRMTPQPSGRTWEPDLEALLGRERRLHHLVGRGATLVSPDQVPDLPGGRHVRDTPAPEVRIDLTGGAPRPGCWQVTFDAEPGEDSAARAVLATRFPVVRVIDGAGEVRAEGRPGSEQPGVAAAALDDVLAGCVQLVRAAVTGHRLRLPEATDGTGQDGHHRVPPTPTQVWVRDVALTPVRAAYHQAYRSPHWRVGWRWLDGPGLLERGALPDDGWQRLPDDGRHFYADPFPIVVGGRTYLFVEDVDHRIGRGVISVTEIGVDGPSSVPRPVLESTVHLSYPVVVEDAGDLWMVPETSGARRVELYRATRFPDEWVLDRVLLDDVDANDATPFRHQGRWWLSATVRRGGSCSDALHLWHAPTLRGPWQPHRRNPVLVDIASARPAGRPEVHDGRLLRPAQDGSRRYGGGLTVAEVVELSPDAFAQRVVARVGPGPAWPGHCLHTVNRAGRLEVIDGSARSFRLASRSRP